MDQSEDMSTPDLEKDGTSPGDSAEDADDDSHNLRRRPRRRWAFGVWCAAAFAVSFLLVVVLREYSDDIQLGTVGEWAGGLGAAAAILVAFHEIRSETKRRREDYRREREAEGRRVWFSLTEQHHVRAGIETTAVMLGISNHSADVVHNLFASVSMAVSGRDERTGLMCLNPFGECDLDVDTYDGGAGGRDDREAAFETSAVTCGPGQTFRVQVETDRNSFVTVLEIVWSDVWGDKRWLRWISGDDTEYGIGPFPPPTN